MTIGQTLYDLRNVHKFRGGERGRFHLEVSDLRIRKGEIVIIRGASGAGKSTLLDLLALTLRPDEAAYFNFSILDKGNISVSDAWRRRDNDRLSALRRTHVGYIVQTGGLLPYLTALENIKLPSLLAGRYDRKRTALVIDRLGIGHVLRRSPASLSVGERQRVAIARAVAHAPDVVIADEPTASLDPVNAEATFSLFLDLVADFGTTAIVATHEPSQGGRFGTVVIEPLLERIGDSAHVIFSRKEQI